MSRNKIDWFNVKDGIQTSQNLKPSKRIPRTSKFTGMFEEGIRLMNMHVPPVM